MRLAIDLVSAYLDDWSDSVYDWMISRSHEVGKVGEKWLVTTLSR